MQHPDTIPEGLETIKNEIFVLVQFYDSNQYDLKIFSKDFDKFNDSWNLFVSTYKKMSNIALTSQEKLKLGETLQAVKDNVLNLIKKVREKY